MSKHSKWAKVKNQKMSADVKKGAVFTKHSRAIAIACRRGADPINNFQLRIAMDAAKAAGMPKDTIDRAVKRGAGELDEEELHEVIYEGYAPGQVAMMIEAVVNNKNRTLGNLRHLLEKSGGNLGQNGAVSWMFQRRGVIRLSVPKNDELELQLIDLGAEDIKEEDGGLTVYTQWESFQKFLNGLAKLNLTPDYKGLEWVAKEKISLVDGSVRGQLDALYEALENDDDIQNYFTNEE